MQGGWLRQRPSRLRQAAPSDRTNKGMHSVDSYHCSLAWAGVRACWEIRVHCSSRHSACLCRARLHAVCTWNPWLVAAVCELMMIPSPTGRVL